MLETPTHARIVLTTAANPHEARTLARRLVEEQLAACATIIPQVESIYRWQGKIENASETLILIKTGEEKLVELETRLLALHSYETPEFLAVAVPEGNSSYLNWLSNSLSQ